MTEEEIDAAEANIRADRREGKIDNYHFQKEMLIVARARLMVRNKKDGG